MAAIIIRSFMHCSLDMNTLYGNCSDGDVRLSGGGSSNQGRLEVCINHAWGTVCNNGFSSEEALVACRQLGKLQVDGEYGSCTGLYIIVLPFL